MNIKLLDTVTANRIAAGEVIENPSCVVKELVENSIDAKAKKILVEIHSGGFDLISVIDDGEGMSRDDCRICLQRHTTSKIVRIEDLSNLSTLGFRGEALASISSVSKMEIVSSNGIESTQIVCESGHVCEIKDMFRNKGTSVFVRSLFYNIPVRKHFQKSVGKSFQDIYKTLTDICLANTGISFSLIKDGKEIFFLPVLENCICNRISTLIDNEFSKNLVQVSNKSEHIKIHGFLTNDQTFFSNKIRQYLFVNLRPVNSNIISSALSDAFFHITPPGKFPGCVLFLDIDPSFVDINVHPKKREVRFSDDLLIKKCILDSVYECFAKYENNVPLQKNNFAETSESFFYDVNVSNRKNVKDKVFDLDLVHQVESKIYMALENLIGRYAMLEKESACDLFNIQQNIDCDYVVFDCFKYYRKDPKQITRKIFDSQKLISTVLFKVPKEIREDIFIHISNLEALGFEVIFIENSISISSVPSCVSFEDLPSVVDLILQWGADSNVDIFDSFCNWIKKRRKTFKHVLNRESAVLFIKSSIVKNDFISCISFFKVSDMGKILDAKRASKFVFEH